MNESHGRRRLRLRSGLNRPAPSLAAFLRDTIATVLIATMSIAAVAAAATVNLPQSSQTVAPAPADARRLSAYFPPPYHSGPLPPAVEEILLRSAPAELHAGCAAMVDSWGDSARGSSRVSLRILAVANGNAWLAYRCDSRLPQFEKYYSERLAAFTSARGTIQFLSLSANEDTRATLYHVGFAETLKLRGAENSAAFVVFADSADPFDREANHDSGNRFSENRFVVVANTAAAARPVLALVTARKRPGANDRDPSNGGEYRAVLRFDHDLTGHLTAIGAYHREQPRGAPPRFGITRYVWNAATLGFDLAKPLPLPPVRRRHPLAY